MKSLIIIATFLSLVSFLPWPFQSKTHAVRDRAPISQVIRPHNTVTAVSSNSVETAQSRDQASVTPRNPTEVQRQVSVSNDSTVAR